VTAWGTFSQFLIGLTALDEKRHWMPEVEKSAPSVQLKKSLNVNGYDIHILFKMQIMSIFSSFIRP